MVSSPDTGSIKARYQHYQSQTAILSSPDTAGEGNNLPVCAIQYMAQNAFGLSQEKRKEYGLDIIHACILCYAGLGSDG